MVATGDFDDLSIASDTKDGISHEEFVRHWVDIHALLARRAEASRCVQSTFAERTCPTSRRSTFRSSIADFGTTTWKTCDRDGIARKIPRRRCLHRQDQELRSKVILPREAGAK
jgi:hypothetical protein